MRRALLARNQTTGPQATAEARAGGGDGLARAVEIVLTPLVFAGVGFLGDRWLGTGPWLALSFGLAAFGLKLMIEWYRYSDLMNTHEQDLAARRPTQRRGIDRSVPQASTLPSGVTLEADSPAEDRSAT